MDAGRTTLLCDYCEYGEAKVIYCIEQPPDEWHTLCAGCADVRVAHLMHYRVTGVWYQVEDFIVEDYVFQIAYLRERPPEAWRQPYLASLAAWLGADGLKAVRDFDGWWEAPDWFHITNS
jgi:hypothetical protein